MGTPTTEEDADAQKAKKLGEYVHFTHEDLTLQCTLFDCSRLSAGQCILLAYVATHTFVVALP